VLGKQNVGIHRVEPVGQYAVKLVYERPHSGLYSWKYLRELGEANAQKWARYSNAFRLSNKEGRFSEPGLRRPPARIVRLCNQSPRKASAFSRVAMRPVYTGRPVSAKTFRYRLRDTSAFRREKSRAACAAYSTR